MTERKGASPSGVIVDLFAGPGGWSEGLRMLGRVEVGIEIDEHACATARAAGHRRIRDDVARLSPVAFTSLAHGWDGCTVEGLIGSPPCPTFSNAGKGAGRRDVDHVTACALELAAGNDTRAEHRARCEDERSMLTVEPLRWALALRPEWVALEQVPPVLAIWGMFAQILAENGYSTWTGVLEAERYGVPQTRERAILMASRTRTVHPPRATHQRHVPGDPARHDVTLDGEILPWVSMADALGWEEGPSPAPHAVRLEHTQRDGTTGEYGERSVDEPAFTVATNSDRWKWCDDPPADIKFRGSNRPNATVRAVEEPAPTLVFGRASNDVAWVAERPSTTIQGDSRVWPPGHKKNADDERAGRDGYGDRAGTRAVRVTVDEAAILQGFRPDYPWQGTRSQQFTQVGNAVPPLLARAVLAELVVAAAELEHAA